MPICGSTWQPNIIERYIQSFDTSTKVVEVMTDTGLGFLKGIGNPQGEQSLASELVGTELAAWLGLQTLEFAIVRVGPENELPMYGGTGNVQPGPALISKRVQAVPLDGGDLFLSKLIRPSDVAKLVVFDTWVMNSDRCAPQDAPAAPPPSRDNLMFSPCGRGRYAMIVFDHTHCFAEGDLWEDLPNPGLIEKRGLYGLFPEFQPYIKREHVLEAVRRLKDLDRETVEQIVQAVPHAWGLTTRVADAWADLIYRRARFVADAVPNLLLEQRELKV